MFASLDENGRVCATSDEQWDDSAVEVEFPEGFDFAAQSDWRVVDGELLHDPPEPTEEQQAARAEYEAAVYQSEMLAALPDAVAELSEAVSDNSDEGSGLADAVAELSELVSELYERLMADG